MGIVINGQSLGLLFKGFSGAFNKGFEGAQSAYGKIAMTVPSSTAETTYGWLGQVPQMREWLGDRILNGLKAHGYTIKNRKFELTITVSRTEMEDDQYGIYGPLFTDMGRAAAEHPDELVFDLLKAGFTTRCYDGQFFFDTDHPVTRGEDVISVANVQAGPGASPPWFLFDTSRAIKPLIFQDRVKAALTALDAETSDNVFNRDEYVYGIRARHNVGFGLWQLAYASREPLTTQNYEAARKAMQSLRGDNGRLLGIRPDLLVCDPSNEGPANRLLKNTLTGDGGSNEWAGTADVLCVPWLAE